mgnify:CR=1 FL=1
MAKNYYDITLALAEEDRAATGQLLETFDQRLPRYDRVNAAAAMGDLRRAQAAPRAASPRVPRSPASSQCRAPER